MRPINKSAVAMTAGFALLGVGSGCNSLGVERKDPPTKVQLEARIQQVQSDPAMSDMAKKMTIQSLKSQENNGAPPPNTASVKPGQ